MTTDTSAPAPGAVLENFMQLWMLPIQLSLDLVEKVMALMLSTVPPGENAAGPVQGIANAAGEQLSEPNDGPGDTAPVPVALDA